VLGIKYTAAAKLDGSGGAVDREGALGLVFGKRDGIVVWLRIP